MNKFATVLLAAAAVFSAPAFAQDNSITLRVDSGSAMASNGGEYVSANTGTPLSAGEKLMVNAGSSVTLNYGNDCTMTYNQPGVYTVPAECTKAGWTNNGRGNAMNAGIIIGAGVLAGVLIENIGDNTPVGPLSPGIRHF